MKTQRLGRPGNYTRVCSSWPESIRHYCRACAFAIAAFVIGPRVVLAQVKPAFNSGMGAARASAGKSLEGMLVSRGLLGSNLDRNSATITPPNGTEVDETVQRARQDGSTISQTQSWTEELTSAALHVELTNFTSKQSQVAFWVLPNHSAGCAMFGRTIYDTSGRALQSEFWRHDRQRKITGAADFPPDLYPEALPAIALMRAVDVTHQGASGRIDQQISPYGFIDQQVTVKDSNQLEVPAGRFAAVRIDSQPNASSILPSWPRFTLGAVSPFLPETTYYFQADPPHRLLRKEQAGTPFIGDPEGITELVRYYRQGQPPADGQQISTGSRRSP